MKYQSIDKKDFAQEVFDPYYYRAGNIINKYYEICLANISRDSGSLPIRITRQNVNEIGTKIYINEIFFDPFLVDCFYEEFNTNLEVNRRRFDYVLCDEGLPVFGFQWYCTPNFYTYEEIKQLSKKIKKISLWLERKYDGEDQLSARQERRIFYELNNTAWKNVEYLSARETIASIYDELCGRIEKMIGKDTIGEYIMVMAP